jgi:hypothetical protein
MRQCASKNVPDRPDWIHEIKQDDYRLLVQREHDRVKLITRNRHYSTKRYPWIVDATRRIRSTQFVLEGEACILGVDGAADFDDLHSQSTMTKCSFTPRGTGFEAAGLITPENRRTGSGEKPSASGDVACYGSEVRIPSGLSANASASHLRPDM